MADSLTVSTIMTQSRAYKFTHALCRQPGTSVRNGIRAGDGAGPDPDPGRFANQHETYVDALRDCGLNVTVLPALEQFPDSVFVEDPALVVVNTAILLRPGAPSRRDEVAALKPDLARHVEHVVTLPGSDSIEGGDVLLTDSEALIGRSQRTSASAISALAEILQEFNYHTRQVNTPNDILHFKSDCGLLDSNTVFASPRLASCGAFDNYRVIETPAGEEGAANIVRVNDHVLMSAGYPAAERKLKDSGYQVLVIDSSEAMRIDGGLSCMSLRYFQRKDSEPVD